MHSYATLSILFVSTYNTAVIFVVRISVFVNRPSRCH